MKRAKKNFLGLLGLSAVTVMTVIAVSIPSPGANATTITDTIKLRVVGTTPNIEILDIKNGAIFSSPERSFRVSYENIENYTLTLTYTNLNNEDTKTIVDEFIPDQEYGIEDYNIRLVTRQEVKWVD